jgi:hypothetical protein
MTSFIDTAMTTGDHIETINAYLDLLIIITASPDAENALPGINKLLFQIGDHVKAIERAGNRQSLRLAGA